MACWDAHEQKQYASRPSLGRRDGRRAWIDRHAHGSGPPVGRLAPFGTYDFVVHTFEKKVPLLS